MSIINFTTWDHFQYAQCNNCTHVKSSFGEYMQLGDNGVYTFTDGCNEEQKQWFQQRTQELTTKVHSFLERSL